MHDPYVVMETAHKARSPLITLPFSHCQGRRGRGGAGSRPAQVAAAGGKTTTARVRWLIQHRSGMVCCLTGGGGAKTLVQVALEYWTDTYDAKTKHRQGRQWNARVLLPGASSGLESVARSLASDTRKRQRRRAMLPCCHLTTRVLSAHGTLDRRR
jgi:hypothetical protein